jgi:hypothetical protein
MARSQRFGLDELMIVNPGLRDGAAYLLGDDNILYRVEGLADPPGRLFLGDDGALYEVIGPTSASGARQGRTMSRRSRYKSERVRGF